MYEPGIQFAGKEHVLELFGIRLLGFTPENARKLLVSLAFLSVLFAVDRLLHLVVRAVLGERTGTVEFWFKQAIRVLIAVILIIGIVSIWFSDPGRLASAAAFITAGLAIASQRVITAVSAYFIILRGKTFHVGDRIVMGGVRGDVIALGFMQTTIMEMGQPPGEEADAPSLWVHARQYTGRIVTITNDNIFTKPVYNYTREFPYIWEEIKLPIPYQANRKTAEQIILKAARHHAEKIADMGEDALKELERRYELRREDLEPRVFYRLTDNWVEFALRFIAEDHGIRHLKDAMSREILDEFERCGIGIASGTYDVVGLPEVKVHMVDDHRQ